MPRTARRPDPAAEVARWNAAVKVGDTVEYIAHNAGGATPERFTTRTEAEVLSGHTAVVWLNGKSGCVAISHCKPVPAAAPLEVDFLSSNDCQILVIEGHVDLQAAAAAFQDEGGDRFPPPRHGWMRHTEVPAGESADWWREICKEGAKGAEPVTLSLVDY